MRLHQARPRRGATIVEMAIVAPVTLLLLIGILDIGLAVWSYNVTSEAAREGARYAVVHGGKSDLPAGPAADDSNVEAAVRKYTFNLAASAVTVHSTWPSGDNKPNSLVTIDVDYAYKPAAFFQLTTLHLRSSVTMTICH